MINWLRRIGGHFKIHAAIAVAIFTMIFLGAAIVATGWQTTDTGGSGTDDPTQLGGSVDCVSLGITSEDCIDYESIISQLTMVTVAYNRPESMILDEPIDISLVLGEVVGESPEDLLEGLPGDIEVTKTVMGRNMSAELQGAAFEVTPAGLQERLVMQSGATYWTWRVVPRSKGQYPLTLSIYVHVGGYGDLSAPIAIQTFRDQIEVKVRAWDQVADFITEGVNPVYTLIAAVAGISGIVWGGFVWWRKKKWRIEKPDE